MENNTALRCCKCFITLQRLKEDKVTDYLLKIVKEDKEAFICPPCFHGW